MDWETQLQQTGTDLAKKLQGASTEVEEERGRRNSVGWGGHRGRGGSRGLGWVIRNLIANPKHTGVTADNSHTTPLLSRALL